MANSEGLTLNRLIILVKLRRDAETVLDFCCSCIRAKECVTKNEFHANYKMISVQC